MNNLYGLYLLSMKVISTLFADCICAIVVVYFMGIMLSVCEKFPVGTRD